MVAEIGQLYGRQSHLIDGGAAREWAETFVADGEFHSPSYPAPVVGADELTRFAELFFERARKDGEIHRHVITNLDVAAVDDETLDVRAYLQIVATARGGDSRLVRFTTISDRVVRQGRSWLILRRTVQRDDS